MLIFFFTDIVQLIINLLFGIVKYCESKSVIAFTKLTFHYINDYLDHIDLSRNYESYQHVLYLREDISGVRKSQVSCDFVSYIRFYDYFKLTIVSFFFFDADEVGYYLVTYANGCVQGELFWIS